MASNFVPNLVPRARVLGEVGSAFKRNFLVTLGTILTITVSLTMLGAVMLVQRQVNFAQRVLYADVELSIFLNDDITADQLARLQADLEAHALVERVLYESKEQAVENAQLIFADEPFLQSAITADVLPASFRVSLVDPEQIDTVRSLFEGRPGIDEIVSPEELLRDLFDLMRTLRGFTLGVALLVAVAAIVLIATTIRLTAFSRREQIAIMKLVGATNWYIRLPFVLEGVLASVIGAFAAFGLLLAAERVYIRDVAELLPWMPFVGTVDVIAIFPILLLGSVIVGAVVSILALRRFLAV